MGTTADKLQNILNAKNAIKEKFSIGDDVKFIDYADNINAGSGGIVVPGNFRPASPSDVLWGKQFFNCRGELVSGSNYGIYSFDILCYNLNGTIPEEYMDLVGWYNKIVENTLSDGTIYERIVRYPDITKRYVFEHYHIESIGWIWELRDEQYLLFMSDVSVEPVEIWEAKNWRPSVIVPDLEGAEILIRSYQQRNSGSAAVADFYLCGYVNRTYVTYDTFVVSGFPEAPFVGGTYTDYDTWETKDLPADVANRNPNGTYTLQNPDAQYVSEYYWQSENGCVIDHWSMAMGQPAIYPGKEYTGSSNFFHVSFEDQNGEYPVPDNADSYVWWYSKNGADDAVVEGGSVTVPVPPEVEKYWEGYKLVLNDEGKYDLAAEKTKLTYADYMPVAGRIYDAACTLEITNADLTEDALWSCPRNMTSVESAEWLISTNGGDGYDGQAVWKAFDSDESTRFFSSTSNLVYIQWQNKKRPVLIKKIEASGLQEGYTYILSGSDDGASFFEIYKGYLNYGSNGFEIPDNGKAYYHHRLTLDSTGAVFTCNMLKAFSQLPREVPK